jgi:hypothetical protein
MPEAEVQNPGQGGAGEAVEPTETPETQPEATPESAPEGSQPDPLDDIQDPAARAEAKKARAILRRNARKGDEPEAPAPQPTYAKADDVAKVVTTQAKALVSEEVREAWDELMKIPLAGVDPMDPQSIAANMADRFVLYKTKQTAPNPTRDLRTSAGVHGAAPKSTEPQKRTTFPKLLDADAQAEILYGNKS